LGSQLFRRARRVFGENLRKRVGEINFARIEFEAEVGYRTQLFLPLKNKVLRFVIRFGQKSKPPRPARNVTEQIKHKLYGGNEKSVKESGSQYLVFPANSAGVRRALRNKSLA
jgi:hypothetical protein